MLSNPRLLPLPHGKPHGYSPLILGAFVTAIIGGLFGLPSLRLKGLYLAVATLAAQQIIQWVNINWDPIDGAIDGKATDALNIPDNLLLGNEAWATQWQRICLLCRGDASARFGYQSPPPTSSAPTSGRAFIAIRDQDIAAEVMGVNLFRYKVLAFAFSSFIVGLAGGLTALHSTAISFERFTIEVSIGIPRHDYHRGFRHGFRLHLWRNLHRRPTRNAPFTWTTNHRNRPCCHP